MASRHDYPVYIISKGRFDCCMTANLFLQNGLEPLVAVEPHEYKDYLKHIPKKNLIKLPFANLGLGSYPARNFCWEHSKNNGYRYHWIFDDNIKIFYKWENGKRKKYRNIITALSYVEAVANKHQVDILGFEEWNFVVKPPKKPFKINTHIYSSLLIKNTIPYRWRLKYNEDIDLCLQVLHNGGTTLSCIYFMIDKVSTVAKMKGGNQDELYKGNDPKKKLLKAKMIEKQWPQYAKTVIRFGRIHHFVDWKVFKKK